MSCFETRFGETSTSPAVTAVPIDFYFVTPHDIRKYMTTKESAIKYADSTLSTVIEVSKNIIAKGATAMNFGQRQYFTDQLVHLQAIDKYLSEQYQTGILIEPSLASKYKIFLEVDSTNTPVRGLFVEVMKFNPDIGQLALIQEVLAKRKAAGEVVGPVNFIPQFSQDKTPILVTPESGVPGSVYPDSSDDDLPPKTGIGTIILVAIGGLIAYNAIKG